MRYHSFRNERGYQPRVVNARMETVFRGITGPVTTMRTLFPDIFIFVQCSGRSIVILIGYCYSAIFIFIPMWPAGDNSIKQFTDSGRLRE